ncbi:MAG TPA: hypothetical protein VIT41_01205 [Microlunatus sp.]
MVTPQVQTATSSRRTLSDQSHSPYERVLAVGLGVALALVAALALMIPSASAQASADGSAVAEVQTAAHGKATPRAVSTPTTGGDSTSAG